jgi:diguanylate cyclase (GGDEF)-like protein
LGAESLKNSRLYAVLLVTLVIFLGLWAYKTKRLQLHFMSLSRLDGLTGICNRHHFISQTQAALEHAREFQRELCIVLWDLDHFKTINDRHGHAMGDFVLQETVSRCRIHLQAHEAFGRFGGEEFIILLPGSGLEVARQRAEQLRTAITGISVGFGGGESRVSASFGIATTKSSGYELRQLLAHADSALYQAKSAGRNRVVLYAVTAAAEKTVSLVAPRTGTGS